MFLFPYTKVKQGSGIIVYGAGDMGSQYVKQILLTRYCELLAVADRNWDKIDAMDSAAMTDADYKYYIDVMARVEKRLIDVGSSY